jgi:hypothetical protein
MPVEDQEPPIAEPVAAARSRAWHLQRFAGWPPADSRLPLNIATVAVTVVFT